MTSVSNSLFQQYFNQEGMITSHLMCVTSLGIKILQLLCYNLFNNNKEALAKHVTWKNHSVIVKFRILRIVLNRKGKFATEVLIFRGSRSQMFFKIGVLKNFAIQKLCLIELCLSCRPTSGMYWTIGVCVKLQKQPL